MKTIQLLDTFLQQVVPHTLSVDQNGELIAQSTASDHFIKFPAGLSPEEFAALAAKHDESNIGQVSAAAQNKMIEESSALIDAIATGEVEVAPAAPQQPVTAAESIPAAEAPTAQ